MNLKELHTAFVEAALAANDASAELAAQHNHLAQSLTACQDAQRKADAAWIKAAQAGAAYERAKAEHLGKTEPS